MTLPERRHGLAQEGHWFTVVHARILPGRSGHRCTGPGRPLELMKQRRRCSRHVQPLTIMHTATIPS